MKPSEILREAARRIECGVSAYGCCAVDTAHGNRHKKACNQAHTYFKLMRPKYAGISWFGSAFDESNQNRRVVALALAAAIAESEGQ